jgi:hypothetical protein
MEENGHLDGTWFAAGHMCRYIYPPNCYVCFFAASKVSCRIPQSSSGGDVLANNTNLVHTQTPVLPLSSRMIQNWVQWLHRGGICCTIACKIVYQHPFCTALVDNRHLVIATCCTVIAMETHCRTPLMLMPMISSIQKPNATHTTIAESMQPSPLPPLATPPAVHQA